MIVTSKFQLVSGKIYTEKDFDNYIFEHYGKYFDTYTFMVMKECTKEEYIEYIIEDNIIPISQCIFEEFFYDISMD